MGKIKQIAKNLRKIKIQKIVELKILSNEDEVVDLNTENQLSKGIKSSGKKMPPYSDASVKIFGKPSGSIRLFDEGDFYRGFYLTTKKFPFIVSSKDVKTDMLVDKYTEDVFGFTPDSRSKIKEIIIDEVQEDFKKAISKAFKVL